MFHSLNGTANQGLNIAAIGSASMWSNCLTKELRKHDCGRAQGNLIEGVGVERFLRTDIWCECPVGWRHVQIPRRDRRNLRCRQRGESWIVRVRGRCLRYRTGPRRTRRCWDGLAHYILNILEGWQPFRTELGLERVHCIERSVTGRGFHACDGRGVNQRARAGHRRFGCRDRIGRPASVRSLREQCGQDSAARREHRGDAWSRSARRVRDWRAMLRALLPPRHDSRSRALLSPGRWQDRSRRRYRHQ